MHTLHQVVENPYSARPTQLATTRVDEVLDFIMNEADAFFFFFFFEVRTLMILYMFNEIENRNRPFLGLAFARRGHTPDE